MAFNQQGVKLEKNEQEVFDYLYKKSGLETGTVSSFFATLLLVADPDGKTANPVDAAAVGAIEIPGFPGTFYIPLKKLILSKRAKFSMHEILKRLATANLIERKFITSLANGAKLMYNGKAINHPIITSFRSEVQAELLSVPGILGDIYGLLTSKAGTTNYNIGQIVLSTATPGFLGQLFESLKPIVNKINESNASYLFAKETRFLTYEEIYAVEGPAAANEAANKKTFQKNGKKGSYIVYPVAYEKVANLVTGLISKWLSKSTTRSTDSSALELENRIARIGGAQNGPARLDQIKQRLGLGGVENDKLASEVSKRLLPVNLPVQAGGSLHDQFNAFVTFANSNLASYDLLLELFDVLGGDDRILPPVFSSFSKSQAIEALNYISSNNLFNERLMFAVFKLLGDDITVSGDYFLARKQLPAALEDALLTIPRIETINKKSEGTGGRVAPSLILSDRAFSRIANTPLGAAFAGAHSSSGYGYVQKGTMSISSLIRGEGNKKLDVSIQSGDYPTIKAISDAINIIAFASALYKWQTQGKIDELHDIADKAKKQAAKVQSSQQVPQQYQGSQQYYQSAQQVPVAADFLPVVGVPTAAIAPEPVLPVRTPSPVRRPSATGSPSSPGRMSSLNLAPRSRAASPSPSQFSTAQAPVSPSLSSPGRVAPNFGVSQSAPAFQASRF